MPLRLGEADRWKDQGILRIWFRFDPRYATITIHSSSFIHKLTKSSILTICEAYDTKSATPRNRIIDATQKGGWPTTKDMVRSMEDADAKLVAYCKEQKITLNSDRKLLNLWKQILKILI